MDKRFPDTMFYPRSTAWRCELDHIYDGQRDSWSPGSYGSADEMTDVVCDAAGGIAVYRSGKIQTYKDRER